MPSGSASSSTNLAPFSPKGADLELASVKAKSQLILLSRSSRVDELLKLSPRFTRGHALRGDALRALGDLDGSLMSWSEALRLDPELHAARYNRAILLIGRERWEEAKADLILLVELEQAQRPPLLDAHMYLAAALEGLGDVEGARSARARYERLRGR